MYAQRRNKPAWAATQSNQAPRLYFFFMLNSAEHGIFSANKYENANNSWHFHIYKQRKFHGQLCLAKMTLQLLVIWDLLAEKISCSADLSMKKVL